MSRFHSKLPILMIISLISAFAILVFRYQKQSLLAKGQSTHLAKVLSSGLGKLEFLPEMKLLQHSGADVVSPLRKKVSYKKEKKDLGASKLRKSPRHSKAFKSKKSTSEVASYKREWMPITDSKNNFALEKKNSCGQSGCSLEQNPSKDFLMAGIGVQINDQFRFTRMRGEVARGDGVRTPYNRIY